VLGIVALAGADALAGLTPGVVAAEEKASSTENEKLDRQHVIACGFTEAEADCRVLLGRTAAKFFELPKLPVMDDHEIA
jgi:plasmid replication initiation protein